MTVYKYIYIDRCGSMCVRIRVHGYVLVTKNAQTCTYIYIQLYTYEDVHPIHTNTINKYVFNCSRFENMCAQV
jgi:hypothetical protein